MKKILRQIFTGATLDNEEILFLEKYRGETAKDKNSSIAQGMKLHSQALSLEINIKMFADIALSAVLVRLTLDAIPVLETVDYIKTIAQTFTAPYDWCLDYHGPYKTAFVIAGFTGLDIAMRGLADKQKAICFPELVDKEVQNVQP